MKIRVAVSKTIQDTQFEPYKIEAEAEKEFEEGSVKEGLKQVFLEVDGFVLRAIERRLKMLEKQNDTD